MTTLQTYQVEDWGKFIEQEEIDLTCPTCRGQNDDCEDCSGSGCIEPIWNTIWNTGFYSLCGESRLHQKIPAEVGSVFAFEWNDKIWFGLTGCSMDLTPYLADAWMTLFPDCEWLPEQFIVDGCNLRGGYVASCLGKAKAHKIYGLIAKSIKGMRLQAASLAQDLKAARKNMAKK